MRDALDRLPPALQVIDPGEPEPGNPFGLGAVAITSASVSRPEELPELIEDSATAESWDPASAELPEPFDLPSAPAASPRLKTSMRPRRQEKGAVGEIVKVVLGGVAGLTLTQGVLWWGFHNDPFDLGKTLGASKLTQWMVPKVYHAADAASNGPAVAAGNAANSNPGTQVAQGNGGFNSKVNWDAVVSGKPEPKPAKAKATGGTPATEDALQAGFDLPDTKPADPLAIDLADPLATAPAAKPTVPAAEPGLDINPIDPEKPQPKPTVPPEPTPPAPDESPSKPVEKPATDPSEKPSEKPAEKPATEPAEKPAEKPAPSSVEPKTEPKPEPKTETADEPMPKPAEPAAAVLRTVAAARAADQQWRDAAGGEKDVRRKAAESLVAVLIDLAGDVQRVDAAAAEAKAAFDAVGGLVKELSAEPGTTKVVEVLTAGNLDVAERKSPAIALLGAVKATTKDGDFFVTQLQLGDKEKRVVRVLSMADPGFAADTKLLVIGDLADTKAQPIEGFSGEPGMVVVARHRGFEWTP
ncbi:MAG: hypothetical protein ACKO38_04755 [Planctomycetota bacterium]